MCIRDSTITVNDFLATINDHLKWHPDLFFQGCVDHTSQALLSLDLFIEHSKGNIFDDSQCVKLIIDENLLAYDVDQELVALVR